MGDPQAPLHHVLAILDVHGALGDDGRLRPDVGLLSLGDHFDWGTPLERAHAAEDGLHLLAWLAAHPADQVTILAGNHDLSRISELAGWDDATFARAQADADAAYHSRDPGADALFRRTWPHVGSPELIARDLGTFRSAQRDLVSGLLRQRRMRAAAATHGLLAVHAGATLDDGEACGAPPDGSAEEWADALNAAFDAAVDASRPGVPFVVAGLHRPADGFDEGRGVLYQRPANPAYADPGLFDGPPRRRFDPRRLPRLTQVVGHVRDARCLDLLRGWTVERAAAPGRLRWLRTDGVSVHYALGTPDGGGHDAVAVFTDGGMQHVEPHAFELLDLARLAPAERNG